MLDLKSLLDGGRVRPRRLHRRDVLDAPLVFEHFEVFEDGLPPVRSVRALQRLGCAVRGPCGQLVGVVRGARALCHRHIRCARFKPDQRRIVTARACSALNGCVGHERAVRGLLARCVRASTHDVAGPADHSRKHLVRGRPVERLHLLAQVVRGPQRELERVVRNSAQGVELVEVRQRQQREALAHWVVPEVHRQL